MRDVSNRAGPASAEPCPGLASTRPASFGPDPGGPASSGSGAGIRRIVDRLPQPVVAFILARLGLTILAAWGVTSQMMAAEKAAGSFLLPPFSGWAALLIEPWTRWDGQWYLKIVEQGYGLEQFMVDGQEIVTHASTAFFPLYPALIWLLSRVLPVSPVVAPALAGTLISSLGTLVGLMVIHRQVIREYGANVADRTIRYLLIFPTAFFFFAVYTEGLFLALSALAMVSARNHRWWQGGLWTGLAAASRPSGILVGLVVGIEYLLWLRRSGRRPNWEAASFLLAPSGLIGYLVYLQARFGNPFAFLEAQQNVIWGRRPAAFWETLVNIITSVDFPPAGLLEPQRVTEAIRPDLFFGGYHEFNGFNLAFYVSALAVTALSYRRVPLSWTLYSAALLLFPLTSPVPQVPLQSLPRYMLPAFPLFITLALWGQKPAVDRLIAFPFVVLLGIFTVRFITWYWVA